MSDEVKASFRQSLITVGVIGIVGTLLGGAFATFWLTHRAAQTEQLVEQHFHVKAEPAKLYHVRIVLKDGGKCQQKVDGVRFAFPVIRPHSDAADGDSLDWEGIEGRGGHPNPGTPLSIVVNFDANNSPFAGNQFTSNGLKVPTSPSGPPVGSADDYAYTQVTVDGVKCTIWDPGVHVTP